MAKKSAVRRRSEQSEFSDDAFENVRASMTYDYNELVLARAAERIHPRTKQYLTFVNLASLLILVFCAWNFRDNNALLIVLAVIAFALLYVWANWNTIQLRLARRGSLALEDPNERRHVVVCDDAVHVQTNLGSSTTYPLSDLKWVSATDECLLASFGRRRYVYIPRRCLSENRYRDLIRFLEDQR